MKLSRTVLSRSLQYWCICDSTELTSVSRFGFRRCAWLREGDYLRSRVTRKLRAILRGHLANAQFHLSNARCESDMRDLYNLNNLARKVCEKMFYIEFSCPPDVNMYVEFDCIDYCLVPPSIHTSYM